MILRPVLLGLFMLLPAAAPLRAEAIALDLGRAPFCLIGETVQVSVTKSLSMVEGRYDYKYVARFDGAALRDTVPFEFPVLVPVDAEDLDALLAITQMKLRVGTAEFQPVDHEFPVDRAGVRGLTLPEDMRVAILIFRLPRALLRERVSLAVTYFQPHYRVAGKDVTALLPQLPDFDGLKNEFLFSRVDFIVEFEAIEAIRLHRISANQSVVQETPERVKVNPVHREAIAVAIEGPARP